MPVVTRQTIGNSSHRAIPTNPVLARIKPMGFDKHAGIRVLLYGSSGSGKTTLWSTFPDPILALICSGGKNPGELRSINTPANRNRISVLNVEHSTDVFTICEDQLRNPTFRTVVLDHGSGLQDRVLAEQLNMDELPPQKTWRMTDQQGWGQVVADTKAILIKLLSLQCNVVLVAHERIFEVKKEAGPEGEQTVVKESADSDVKINFVKPQFTPSLIQWVEGAVDYTVQCYRKQKEVVKQVKIKVGKEEKVKEVRTKGRGVDYCLRTREDNVHSIKFRVPHGDSIPDYILDPTYSKIMDVINASIAPADTEQVS